MKINNSKTPPLFKCRASALGKLMGQPKSKADKEAGELSQTAKTFVLEWYKEQLYERRAPIDSKYMTKGNECEDASIAYTSAFYGKDWENNKMQYENDWITGEPDIIDETHIIDIKNSWDFTTFPLFSKTCPKKEYEWQVRGYMWMLKKYHGAVVYTLMDTPAHLIPSGLDPALFQYEGLPDHLRIKRFNIEHDDEAIEQIKQKVEKAREFISAIAL